MASKGNRVLKVKTQKARKMDRDYGRSLKYQTLSNPQGTREEILPTKADVSAAEKGKKISSAEASEYNKQIDEARDSRVRKTKSAGTVRGARPEDVASMDKALDKPLKAPRQKVKEAKSRVEKTEKTYRVPKDGGYKTVKKTTKKVVQPSKYELEGIAKDKATNKLTERGEGIGLVPSLTVGSRKIVEAELNVVQKRAAGANRRRKEKEVEAGVVALAKRDKDLKPGQLSTSEKVYVKSGFGKGKKKMRPEVEAARDAEVKRQEKESKVREARKVDVGALEELPKGLPSTPGRPREREVTIDQAPQNERLSPKIQRRLGRKLKYNIERQEKSKGYKKAAAGSTKLADRLNTKAESKVRNADTRARAVARNEDLRRDALQANLLSSAVGKPKKERKKMRKSALGIIRPEKDVTLNSQGRVLHVDQPGVKAERTIVDPLAIDKKYSRVVPVGAPRLLDKIQSFGKDAKVSLKAGSNKPVTSESRLAAEEDPTKKFAADKRPKFEIVELNAPAKTTGLGLRGSSDEALYSVAKHVFGEKNAAQNMKHVRTFAQNLAKNNRHRGNADSLVSGMLSVFNKDTGPKLPKGSAPAPEHKPHIERQTFLRDSIKKHAKEAKGRASLAAENRQAKLTEIKEQQKLEQQP